jgi:hypothetical protein
VARAGKAGFAVAFSQLMIARRKGPGRRADPSFSAIARLRLEAAPSDEAGFRSLIDDQKKKEEITVLIQRLSAPVKAPENVR